MALIGIIVLLIALTSVQCNNDTAASSNDTAASYNDTATSSNDTAASCDWQDVKYSVGDAIPTSDPCMTCECLASGLSCLSTQCARPNCADYVENSTICCAHCPNGYTTCEAGGSQMAPNSNRVRYVGGGCVETCKCGYPVSSLQAQCTTECTPTQAAPSNNTNSN